MLTQLSRTRAPYYDIRQANDVECRPHATYVRVAPFVDNAVKSGIEALSRRELAVGAFQISDAPAPGSAAADELISLFGSVADRRAAERADLGRGLRTFGADSTVVPDFALIFAKSEISVFIADFAGFGWRLTRQDTDALRESAFRIGCRWGGPLITGDPGNPHLRYDPAGLIAETAEGRHSLSTLDLLLTVPGASVELLLEPGSVLILDNWRMLVSFAGAEDITGYTAELVFTRR